MTDELDKATGGSLMVGPTGKARGFDGMEQEDVIIPRIALAQPTTKFVMDGDVPVGAIYNTVTRQSYIDPTTKKAGLQFISVAFAKNRRLWNKDNKNDTLCMSNDSKISTTGDVCATACPFNAFDWSVDDKKQRVPPACTLYYNYLSLLAPFDSDFPSSISLGKTSAKSAKQLNSFYLMSGQDIFASVLELTTEKKENAKGAFFIFKVRPIGRVPLELYKRAEQVHLKLKTMNYTIHEEGANDEAQGGAGDDPIPF